jgi:tripartite-type tricarboxylate transporter receptor subunit TctC
MMLRARLAALALLLAPELAIGQEWPQRPVRLIVPYVAGGGTDSVARVLAQKLGDSLGQRFVVENKAGASGMIGTQSVAKGEADGYTFLVATPAEIAINQSVFKDIAYDALADLTPVTMLAWTPLLLAAHPSLHATSAEDLISLARARPLNFSSPGIGTAHHLTGEYINKLQSTQLVHIPYRGAAAAVADTVGGQVALTISGMPPVVAHLQAGALKAIAVTSKRRAAKFPDIPALAEIKGFEEVDFYNWFGLFARAGTPQPILDRLATASVLILQDPQVRSVLQTQAAEPVGNTPTEFRDFIRAEAAKYQKIVAITGVKVK